MGWWGSTLDIEFSIENGELIGAVTKPPCEGRLSAIRISVEWDKPTIYFTHACRKTFYLNLEKDGTLTGDGFKNGEKSSIVRLRPVAKQ